MSNEIKLLELFSQVSQSNNSIFELASRTDERVKILLEKQTNTDEKIDKLVDNHIFLATKVATLEASNDPELDLRVRNVETKIVELSCVSKTAAEKIRDYFENLIKVIAPILAAWFVWKFGFK